MQSKKNQCLNINVITLVVYATNNKFIYYGQKSSKKPPTKTPQKPAKNPMRTKICSNQPKTFNDSLTKNLLKILNNNKNSLILPNKQKTFYVKRFI
jgi:hypothetical protein